jgi:hypothetical protein
MNGKPKLSPDSTYVFEDEDIEAYDDLSLTRAMRDASGPIIEKLIEDASDPGVTMEDIEFDSLPVDD